MLSIGDTVTATVSEVEAHGMRLVYAGISILVLIPEVSWHASVRDCREFASAGQRFDVKVLRYIAEQNLYLGSLKHAHPEADPWHQSDWLEVDRIVSGIVHGAMVDDTQTVVGYYLDVAPGIRTLLRAKNAHRPLSQGDSITARITHINHEDRKVEVEQTDQHHGDSGQRRDDGVATFSPD
jgi:ribosomal protein S1